MTMMNRILILCLTIICFSCKENKSPSDKKISDYDIEQLIEKNINKRLFLSFWSGMTYDEFDNVKKIENKAGNLKNNKFIIPPLEFEIIYDSKSKKIKLLYQYINDNPYFKNQDEALKKYNQERLNEVIETLDAKYDRIDLDNYLGALKTKINYPNENDNVLVENKITGTILKTNVPYTLIYKKESIIWKDCYRAIYLEYTIIGDLKKSIEFYLNISYYLFDDFLLELENKLLDEKKDIELKNKENKIIEIETEKSKSQL